MKIIYRIGLFCIVFTQNSFAQIKVNSYANISTMSNNSAFLDASSSPSWKSTTNIGKGLIFPSVNLVTLVSLVQAGSTSSTNNPNRFDGMVVYNTVTGISGIGAVAVKPGFYYYSNSSTNINGGTWATVGMKDEVVSPAVVTAISAYAILNSDSTILCDASSAGFTLTLPAATAANSGKIFIIRKIDLTDNELLFSPSFKFAQGVIVSSLNYPKTLRVQSDGSNWVIID